MEHNLLLMGGGNNWSSTSWGSWQTASYTGTVDNTGGGAFSGSGNSVTAGANSSTSSRSGNLRLSQTRSGIQENGNSWPSPSNINVPLSQDGKTVSTYIVQFHDDTYEFGTNTTITSGEYTGETLGSVWTLWVSEGDKISGIIEIENTGNLTKGYLFYIDNYLDNQKTLTPGQVVSETFSFSDVKSHHAMTLQEA